MNRKIRNAFLWMILVTTVTLVGVWQIKAAISREFQSGSKDLPPPLKTRVAIRPPHGVFGGNVVEDYIERCDRGLTDGHIGWILTDFRNAGLDSPPAEGSQDEVFITYHKLRNLWYRDAIADAMRLSPHQSAEIDRNLVNMLQELSDACEHGSAEGLFEKFTTSEIHALFRYGFFAEKSISRFPPRGLFTPNPQQQDILDHSWGVETADPFENEPPADQAPPIDPSLSTLKGKTAATYPIDEDYPIPVGFYETDQTFPILKSQQLLGVNKGDLSDPAHFIHNIHRLHPAQLKVMLLYSPELAETIQSALDNASH